MAVECPIVTINLAADAKRCARLVYDPSLGGHRPAAAGEKWEGTLVHCDVAGASAANLACAAMRSRQDGGEHMFNIESGQTIDVGDTVITGADGAVRTDAAGDFRVKHVGGGKVTALFCG